MEGAAWFHETLVDADLAINSMMWQNAGGAGMDPWSFALSPVSHHQDPAAAYVRRWVRPAPSPGAARGSPGSAYSDASCES
jgi:deoxyribodipyrimidine photolyase